MLEQNQILLRRFELIAVSMEKHNTKQIEVEIRPAEFCFYRRLYSLFLAKTRNPVSKRRMKNYFNFTLSGNARVKTQSRTENVIFVSHHQL